MKTIPDGHYSDLPNSDYHGCSAVSRSQLMWLATSDNYFLYRMNNNVAKEPSEQMQIGTLVHLMVLEPHAVDGLVIIAPEFNRRTKAGKEEESLFIKAHESKIIVTPKQYHVAEIMAQRLFERIEDELPLFFAHSQNENSIIWTYDGVQYKCRPDAFVRGVVLDVKTCRDGSKRAFQRAAIEEGYFLQAAMMSKGLASIGIEMSNFAFACVENTEPYTTASYIIDDDALEYGERLFRVLHERLKRLRANEAENAASKVDYPSAYIGVPAWASYWIEE